MPAPVPVSAPVSAPVPVPAPASVPASVPVPVPASVPTTLPKKQEYASSAHADYMLGKFQSVPAISGQIREDGYEYYLVVDEEESAGYFALVADEGWLGKAVRPPRMPISSRS